jgi:hypothetical protein
MTNSADEFTKETGRKLLREFQTNPSKFTKTLTTVNK